MAGTLRSLRRRLDRRRTLHRPAQGERRFLDLVVRLPVRVDPNNPRDYEPRDGILLVHIEIESSDRVEPFRRRAYDYYHHLDRTYDLDILPVAVYLRVGLERRGRDMYVRRVWDRTPLRFQYDYVGLPARSGEDYLHGDNPLLIAWSALMRWRREERVPAALTAIERIVRSEEPASRKLLLVDCIQGYPPLEPTQQIELRDLLREPERGMTPMIKTLSDEWIEEAHEAGLKEGQAAVSRRLLTLQLEQRFGPLSEASRQRVQSLTIEQIEPIMVALLTAPSLADLGLTDEGGA